MNLLLLNTNQSLIEESTNTSRVYSGLSFCYVLLFYTLINLKFEKKFNPNFLGLRLIYDQY
jgi:hypothetical protein